MELRPGGPHYLEIIHMPQRSDSANDSEIRLSLERFSWKGDDRSTGWKRRDELSKGLIAALESEDADKLMEALERIHTWGLPGRLPVSVRNNKERVLALLKRAVLDGPSADQVAELLSFDRIGIATVSKWIGLLEQEQFAIFDSRVSVALRMLREKASRCFPVLPRRRTGKHTPWPSDRVSRDDMALYYLRYLAHVRDVGHAMDLQPSEVEMALFMIGDQSCNDKEGWKRDRGPLLAF